MLVKLSITDVCGAHCTTCRQHEVRPQLTMRPQRFAEVLRLVEPYATHLFINGTGDYLHLHDAQLYSDVLRDWPHACKVSVTTNAGWTGRPRIWASVIVCSLNAVTEETFDAHIGLDCGLARVLTNIRYLAQTHGCVEVHSLVWEHNPDPGPWLLQTFGDLPVSIRLSTKVENQGRSEVVGGRVPCDYLEALVIDPAGRVRLCPHDWQASMILGAVDDLPAALARRGPAAVCDRCNYNTTAPGRAWYIRGSSA